VQTIPFQVKHLKDSIVAECLVYGMPNWQNKVPGGKTSTQLPYERHDLNYGEMKLLPYYILKV
jgi:hypothetical protein